MVSRLYCTTNFENIFYLFIFLLFLFQNDIRFCNIILIKPPLRERCIKSVIVLAMILENACTYFYFLESSTV